MFVGRDTNCAKQEGERANRRNNWCRTLDGAAQTGAVGSLTQVYWGRAGGSVCAYTAIRPEKVGPKLGVRLGGPQICLPAFTRERHVTQHASTRKTLQTIAGAPGSAAIPVALSLPDRSTALTDSRYLLVLKLSYRQLF